MGYFGFEVDFNHPFDFFKLGFWFLKFKPSFNWSNKKLFLNTLKKNYRMKSKVILMNQDFVSSFCGIEQGHRQEIFEWGWQTSKY